MYNLKKSKKQKGITLVALIITIVVLLILALVTINAVRGDGIIGKAQKAKEDYERESDAENKTLEGYLAYLEENSPGGSSSGETEELPAEITWTDNGEGTFTSNYGVTVAIGDYVDYTYDIATDYSIPKFHDDDSNETITQTTGLRWRVLGINEKGELELISETPTSGTLTLGGSAGYNNGVFLLNDICKSQYSNSSLGITARSLKIEDLEKQYTEEGIKGRDEYVSDGLKYGNRESKSYYDGEGLIYPQLYALEAKSGVNQYIREDGIGRSDPYYQSKEDLTTYPSAQARTTSAGLTITQTAYQWSNTPSSYFKNETFYNMIFDTDTSYFLASRCVTYETYMRNICRL